MKISSSGRTHVGMKRSHNEDCLRLYRDENLFIVADGMGGHASGEVASELSAETLAAFFRSTSHDNEITWPFRYDREQSYEENRLRVGIQLSNYRIHASAVDDPQLRGMGTTIVATYIDQEACYIGHVGDSRVYRYREGKLEQLTEDHSLLNDYIKMKPGGMTPEEIEAFPHKNVIVRALGMREYVTVDVLRAPLQKGDLFLLCSDGLSGMLTDPEMEEILAECLSRGGSLDEACSLLIDGANRNGGNDNITVILT
ncbi:MAG: Stp1/IreP family PP2C-type Ser/Thr phosphatase, partial [Myxococcota bacterium]|nr:Stp1/IreP family PP2C-type Ser/Thr phosphatase [Myxococcota bacterium]